MSTPASKGTALDPTAGTSTSGAASTGATAAGAASAGGGAATSASTAVMLSTPSGMGMYRDIMRIDDDKRLEGLGAVNRRFVTDEEMLEAIRQDGEIMALALKGRGMINGADVVSVASAFAKNVIAARRSGEVMPILLTGVFAVGLAYTISESWVADYAKLPTPHMFQEFEVTNRQVIAGVDAKAKWITTSNMNASAVRILGHLIVYAAPERSFLAELRKKAYTVFDSLPEDDKRERTVLMREAQKEVGSVERQVAVGFQKHFMKYASIISEIFGSGGSNAEEMFRIAETYAGFNF